MYLWETRAVSPSPQTQDAINTQPGPLSHQLRWRSPKQHDHSEPWGRGVRAISACLVSPHACSGTSWLAMKDAGRTRMSNSRRSRTSPCTQSWSSYFRRRSLHAVPETRSSLARVRRRSGLLCVPQAHRSRQPRYTLCQTKGQHTDFPCSSVSVLCSRLLPDGFLTRLLALATDATSQQSINGWCGQSS
jgi:hypothetical protein